MELYNYFIESAKMTIFNRIKTNNIFLNTILSTISLSLFTFITKYIYENNSNMNINDLFNFYHIKSFFVKKNSMILEGKKSIVSCSYSLSPHVSSLYTERFKAVWNHIISQMKDNPSIYQIKEQVYNITLNSSTNKYLSDIFFVSQKKEFIFNKELQIYAITKLDCDESTANDKNSIVKTDKIIIEIFSYHLTTYDLNKYVDDITINYLSSIQNERKYKKFIYTLIKSNFEDSRLECWNEFSFETSRSFNNLFFPQKEMIINKINFFCENKKWYFDKGIPYTLGIGLSGPPGTGKTSFIKALAMKMNLHIIVLSFKIIKNRKQLYEFYFEQTYNSDNIKNSITFDKKLVVFEDIDCIGDIVLDRSKKDISDINTKNDNHSQLSSDLSITNCLLNQIIENQAKDNGDQKDIITVMKSHNNEDPITLDDILNLWDGIRETPGRVLVISSNHYNKLDPALIRPGRIDLNICLDYVNHETLTEMYQHLFEKPINPLKLESIKENCFTPADIINTFITSISENIPKEQQEEKFIQLLLLKCIK